MINMNELEKMIACCEKLLKDAIGKNPKMGLKIDSENKMRYKDALNALYRLETYFSMKGASSRSFSICSTCTNWDTRAHNSVADSCGSCMIRSIKRDYHVGTYHAYDTCEKHSKKGGGAGLA